MNIAKVTYEDKEAIQNDETIAEKNKVTANNMNQIKKAINDNADFLTEVKNTVDELNGDVGNIKIVQTAQNSTISNMNNAIEQNSEEIYENANNIIALQKENTALKEELERQKEDNKLNGLTEDNEGEMLHITNTTGARFNSLEIFGNEKQETRSGKNIYGAGSKWFNNIGGTNLNVSERTDSSCVLTATGRGFTSFGSGQAGGSSEYRTEIEPNTEYTFSLKAELLSGSNGIGIYGFFSKDGSSEYFSEKHVDYADEITFVTPEDAKYFYFRVDIFNASASYRISEIQLEKGSKATEFEEYGAMPSFDCPSEVKAVGNNINIYNEKTAELNKYISGTLGELGTSSLSKVSDYIELTEDEYVINFTNDSNLRGYSFFDINKKFVSGEDNKKAPYTVQKPTNAKYIRFAAPINALDVKIEEGNQATPYSPYNMGSVEIDVVNKNWLKLEDIEETTSKGITYSCKKGILKIQGTATAGVQINLAYNIVLKPNTYNHSVNTIIKGLYLSFDNIRDTMLNQQNGITKTFNIDIEKTYSKYFLWIDANTTVDLELKPQLEIGEQATSYVEHQSQTKIMPIQQEMLEGDYISDIEHHGWKKKILNGTDVTDNGGTFAEFQTNGNIARTISIPDLLVTNVRYDIKCEELPARGESVWAGVDYGINTYIGQAKILVSIPIEEIKTVYENELTVDNYVAAFNAYLSAKPITIYYKLATPIDLELTEEQKIASEQIKQAHTYKEVTNVYTEDEVGAIIKTNTNVDLKSLINNIQEQLIAE